MKRMHAVLLALVMVLSLMPAAAMPQAEAAEMLPAQDWKQGTYYATLNPNVTIRRYTVIPCQEGEVYTLNFPSDNWAVYAHLADAQGDFGYEYLLRTGKPRDIVIKEMDGRIPTEIRLTTYNRTNTSLVLNDENFASFDVTIQKSTKVAGDLLWDATWNQGTPVNPTTALRKHTYIPCQLGDTFRIGITSTYWDVYILPADENGPLTDDDTYFSKDGTFTVAPVDGKDPTAIIVVAVPDPQNTSITDLIWDSFSVSCVKETKETAIEGNTFTFATQNVGLWNDGVNQGVAANKVEERAAAWQKEMEKHSIDILVGQEWLPYLDSGKTVDANSKVFGNMYPYTYGTNTATYDGKNIVSRAPLSNISYETMVSNVGRRYLKAYTVIGGKQVCIINAHLSFEEDINTNRKEEIVQLLNIAQSEQYVIIAGDFNVFTADEFKIFEDAGYSLANAGEFGEFNTWPNLGRDPTREVNRVLDNIIVGPGIKIHNAYAEDHRLSDHALLVAELELLEEGTFVDNRFLCEHCNRFVEWIPCTLTNGGTASAFRESGHYYLTQDLPAVNSQFGIGVKNEATPDVVIDLRGHAVKSTARAFYVRNGSKLTIVDTVGCGTITAGSTATGGFAYVEGGSTFSLYDGSIYSTGAPTADRKGGALYAETGAVVNIYGGEIYGGYSSHGSAIYCGNKNTLNISGGTIYGGTATAAGGGIYIYAGTLNMTGGKITGGKGGSGGGIYLYTAVGNLSGGTITGNSGTYGGNIHVAGNATQGGLNLGGCTITNGVASGSGKDIYLSGDGKMKVLSAFVGTSYIAVNADHLTGNNPGDVLNTALDSTEGYFPGKLILESLSSKPQLCGAIGDTKLYIASAATVDASHNLSWYANNATAVAYYSDSVCLMPAAGEVKLVGGDYVVDIGGKNLNITGSGNVVCFDSSNNTFKTFGTATIQGPVLTNSTLTRVDGKDYVALNESGVWSFHRLDMGIQGVALRPSAAGFYYTGAWQMDDALAAKTDRFGVAVSLAGVPSQDLMVQDRALWTEFAAEDLQKGMPITGVMIGNVLKSGDPFNDVRGRTPVFGAAYLALNDGTILVDEDSVVYSLYDVVKLLDENAYEQNQAALDAFYAGWETVLGAWELENMGK